MSRELFLPSTFTSGSFRYEPSVHESFTHALELSGAELTIKTGSGPRNEVVEVYASEADAALARDLLREKWLAEGKTPVEPGSGPSRLDSPFGGSQLGGSSPGGSSLILGASAPPPPKRGGGFLVGLSGERLTPQKAAPEPLRRYSKDPLAADEKLAAFTSGGGLTCELEGGLVVAALAQANDAFGGGGSPLRTLLASKLAKSSLRRLTIEVMEDGDLEDACAIVGKGLPPVVESLTLAVYEGVEQFLATRVDVSRALPGLGKLRRLELQAGSLQVGSLDLPELRELHVRAGGLPPGTVRAVLAASWPRLESLTLWFGSARYGATSKAADLAPLFSGERFPALRSLALQACEPADEVAAALAVSPLAARLRRLEMSYGLLTDAGVAALASAKASLTLESLVLHDTAVGAAGRAAAQGLAKEVVVDSPRGAGNEPNDSVDHFVPLYADGEFIYLFDPS